MVLTRGSLPTRQVSQSGGSQSETEKQGAPSLSVSLSLSVPFVIRCSLNAALAGPESHATCRQRAPLASSVPHDLGQVTPLCLAFLNSELALRGINTNDQKALVDV